MLKKSSPSSILPPKLDLVFLIGEGEAIEVEGPTLEAVEADETERGRLKDDEGGVRADAGSEREEEARVIRVGVEEEDIVGGERKKKAKGGGGKDGGWEEGRREERLKWNSVRAIFHSLSLPFLRFKPSPNSFLLQIFVRSVSEE